MKLEEIFDNLEKLNLRAKTINALAYLLWSSLHYNPDNDPKALAAAADHLFLLTDEFHSSFYFELRRLCPIATENIQ